MSKPKIAIPVPGSTHESVLQSVQALKQLAEILTGQRGPKTNMAVTWQDLVDVGLIKADQVPR